MALNPYTAPTLQNYNASPPSDDGTKVAANEVTWDFHIGKIGDPLVTYTNSDVTSLNSAFESLSLWGETVAELTAATSGDIQSGLVATRGYFSANDGQEVISPPMTAAVPGIFSIQARQRQTTAAAFSFLIPLRPVAAGYLSMAVWLMRVNLPQSVTAQPTIPQLSRMPSIT